MTTAVRIDHEPNNPLFLIVERDEYRYPGEACTLYWCRPQDLEPANELCLAAIGGYGSVNLAVEAMQRALIRWNAGVCELCGEELEERTIHALCSRCRHEMTGD